MAGGSSFPYSDVDLLLLFESEKQAQAQKDSISAFLQSLWDAGLRMSHSVRTPAECAELHDSNIELNVSLLDQRYLTGDRTLYADLARRLPRFIHGSRDALVRNLSQLTRERHAKYADTFYHLEPNIKETPGGLRDFQLVCWLEQLHNTEPAPCRLGRSVRRTAAGFPLPGPPPLLSALPVRPRQQPALFRRTGHGGRAVARRRRALDAGVLPARPSDQPRGHARAGKQRSPVERPVRAISRPSRAPLQCRFQRTSRSAFISALPNAWMSSPAWCCGLFEFMARHNIRASADAEQQIESRLPRLRAHFADTTEVWPALSGILSQPHAALGIRGMHDTGVLTAIFPELETIECLVIRDFFHRYTVDEHTLVAMQTIDALRQGGEQRQRAYADLLSEIRQPAVLLFALLFHDAGKGTPGKGTWTHRRMPPWTPMTRIGIPTQDRETVLFLIDRHLELSSAMHSRDVFDPQTIRDVARRSITVERLKALTLLDICGYQRRQSAGHDAVARRAVLAALSDGLQRVDARRWNPMHIEAIPCRPAGAGRIPAAGSPPATCEPTPKPRSSSIALEERQRAARLLRSTIPPLESAWQMTLVASDRPGLFASAAGASPASA